MKKKTSKLINTNYFIGLLLALLLMVQCDDILESDISDNLIVLFAPSDGVVLDSGDVTFSWDLRDDVDEYQLQVVTPSFERPAQVVLDTTLTGGNFSFALDSGRYEWGVRGLNSAFSTIFSISAFTVNASGVTTNELNSPSLVAPGDGQTLTGGTLLFVWDDVAKADNYLLRIAQPQFENPDIILVDTLLTTTRFSFSLPEDGPYAWGVRASNETNESSFVSRTLTIASPTLTTPVLSAPRDSIRQQTSGTLFSWQPVVGATSYRLEVVSPSFTTPLSRPLDTLLTETNFTLSELLDGIYEWRVTAINTGNEEQSSVSSFTLFSIPDISNELVVLITPGEGSTRSEGNVIFEWNALPGATQYRYRLVSPAFDNLLQDVLDTVITDTQLTLPLDSADYEWRVTGLNSEFESSGENRSLIVR